MAQDSLKYNGYYKDSRDGNIYEWVRFGKQLWMSQNLNFDTSVGSWCFEDDTLNCSKYGRLYSFEGAKNACPEGWQLPSDKDWDLLEKNLEGQSIEYIKMIVDNEWSLESDLDSTNVPRNSLKVLPAGTRANRGGGYADLGEFAVFWTSTKASKSRVWLRYFSFQDDLIHRMKNDVNFGLSVRCVRK